MATPSSRQEFKDYVLRRLGSPVIDINVDSQQVEDRIDDALGKFRDYHYDGTEHAYVAHQVTSTDVSNKYITLDESIIGVTRVFDISSSLGASNLFNVRYQIMLNEMFNITSTNVAPYVMAMRHVETLEEIFVGKKPIRFNRHMDRLHIDMKWDTDINVGQYLMIDCYKTVDPETYTDVWNDNWLKKYATALVKQQWGMNLSKFQGMQLPGGVTFDGQRILQEATQEVEALEKEVINDYGLPVSDFVG